MYGGFILIEVCDANPAARNELFQLESDYPGVTVMENSCMSECELCARSPYVFLNGELIAQESLDELLVQIRARLSQLLDDVVTDT